jgi:hypothetical protein
MTKVQKSNESELHSDAWDRFECAVDQVVKAPPQHRTKPKPEKRKARPKKKKGVAAL